VRAPWLRTSFHSVRTDMTIADIAREIYAEQPTNTLFHYTSIRGLLGIVPSGQLCASDIHYFSDAGEMKRTVALFRNAVAHAPGGDAFATTIRKLFLDWINNRLNELGHSIFAASFTANGNLLSQWRSYCDPGKGISIGFDPEKLKQSAADQSWNIGKCIYDEHQQNELAKSILDTIEKLARTEFAPPGRLQPNSAQHFFMTFEDDLLRIAALLKYPAFSEEQEWRIVSPVTADYAKAPIEYREGHSMLMPYMRFRLPSAKDRDVDLEHVWVGPTPHVTNSMMAVNNFLTKNRAAPRLGVSYCGIPYRTW
jgi:hypothetical protein